MASDDETNAPATVLSTAAPAQASIDFLDLSAELRSEIYYLALVKNRDIHIRRNGNPQRKWFGYITDAPNGVSINSSRMKFSRDQLGINTALLRVNRQVYSEAKHVLYGADLFAMHWGDIFKCLPESTRPFLRHLKITGMWYYSFDRIMTRLTALAPVLKLSKLELAMEQLAYSELVTQKVPRLMLTLMPMLKASRKVQGLDIDSAASLVRIAMGDDCFWLLPPYKNIELTSVWNAEILKQAKELLAKSEVEKGETASVLVVENAV